MEETLILIPQQKDHDSGREISSLLTKAGFRITQKKNCSLTQEQSIDFYQHLLTTPQAVAEEVSSAGALTKPPTKGGVVVKTGFGRAVESLCGKNVLALVAQKLDAHQDVSALLSPLQETAEGLHFSSGREASIREIQFFFPNHTIESPTTSSTEVKIYLEDQVYPTLLQALTQLCKEKPEEGIEWLGRYLLSVGGGGGRVVEPSE